MRPSPDPGDDLSSEEESDEDVALDAAAPPGWQPIITHTFLVENECHGYRLDRFLQKRIKRLSRARIQRVIHGDCTVDGRPGKPAMLVYVGQTVRFTRPAPPEPVVPREVGVLYQDAALYALDKPAGLPIHPSARYHYSTLTAVLRERFPGERLQVGHRLDRETSGVLLVARTPEAASAIKQSFARRRVDKTYLALAYGLVSDEEVTVEAPIGPCGGAVRVRMAVRTIEEGGQPARTAFRVLARFPDADLADPQRPGRRGLTLLECRPHTGRQHQIRVHLWHLGHPIVGDKLYPDEELFMRWADDGDDAVREALPLPRHALHAARLSFPHPQSGDRLTVLSPLPADLATFLRGLAPDQDLELRSLLISDHPTRP